MVEITDSFPIMIIDAQNLFIRSYAAYPSMSANGYQMGGTIGFLKTLTRLIAEFQPKAVVVAWESGGSTKRRKIYPEYKLGKGPEKLNRFYDDDLPDTDENRQHQIVTLVNILKKLPIYQVYAPDVEGDDIIAYLCTGRFRDNQKIIVSSDKDLYQLIDDKTRVYSLYKKTFITDKSLFAEYNITSRNFALAKAICGDKGDNIPGVKGVGFKTLAKGMSILSSDKDIILSEALDYAAANRHTSSVCEKIFLNKDIVERNWKLVYLNGSMLDKSACNKIDYLLDNFEPTFKKKEIVEILTKEAISNFDLDAVIFEMRILRKLQ